MQHYIMDLDIMRILKHVIEEEYWLPTFARDFPEMAAMAYPGPDYPSEAIAELGFGVVPGYAPGFNPGPQANDTEDSTEDTGTTP